MTRKKRYPYDENRPERSFTRFDGSKALGSYSPSHSGVLSPSSTNSLFCIGDLEDLLSKDDLDLLFDYHIVGESQVKMAKQNGVNPGTICRRLQRAVSRAKPVLLACIILDKIRSPITPMLLSPRSGLPLEYMDHWAVPLAGHSDFLGCDPSLLSLHSWLTSRHELLFGKNDDTFLRCWKSQMTNQWVIEVVKLYPTEAFAQLAAIVQNQSFIFDLKNSKMVPVLVGPSDAA